MTAKNQKLSGLLQTMTSKPKKQTVLHIIKKPKLLVEQSDADLSKSKNIIVKDRALSSESKKQVYESYLDNDMERHFEEFQKEAAERDNAEMNKDLFRMRERVRGVVEGYARVVQKLKRRVDRLERENKELKKWRKQWVGLVCKGGTGKGGAVNA